MILFFDENFPVQIARALSELGYKATHLADELPRGTSDEQLFQHLNGRDCYLVTQDVQMSRKPHQKLALLQAGLGVFVFTGRAERSLTQMMVMVLQNLERMTTAAERTSRPFIYGISDRGRIDRLDG
ncbi:MAG: DUF5615 family PIN-like protein [Steroidobacteraceae bacterium]